VAEPRQERDARVQRDLAAAARDLDRQEINTIGPYRVVNARLTAPTSIVFFLVFSAASNFACTRSAKLKWSGSA
jgi:hypothetical protein